MDSSARHCCSAGRVFRRLFRSYANKNENNKRKKKTVCFVKARVTPPLYASETIESADTIRFTFDVIVVVGSVREYTYVVAVPL